MISFAHRNDFLDNKCDISSAEDVAANIVTVIGQIVENSPEKDDIKILYFGYSVPSADVCGNGQTAQLFEEQGTIIFNAIKSSNYTEYVTTFDISEMFVKWGTGLSDSSYYYDEIHVSNLFLVCSSFLQVIFCLETIFIHLTFQLIFKRSSLLQHSSI